MRDDTRELPLSGRRIAELDGLRGIAVLMVLAFHLFFYSMLHEHWTGLARAVMLATMPGWLGVDLFFVLSGFLITGILLDTRNDDRYLRNFYARRALRILPLYYAVLLIILICYPHSGSYVLISFSYLSNMSPIFGIPMVDGALWSLSVEEHFYLVWPWLIGLFRMPVIVGIATLVCIAEPVFRAMAFGHIAYYDKYSWFRLDGLACGGLVACFLRSSWYSTLTAARIAMGLVAAGVVFILIGIPFGILNRQNALGAALEITLMNWIFAGAILYAAARSGSPRLWLLRARPLVICADLSYCIYIIHLLILDGYDYMLQKFHIELPMSAFGRVSIRGAVVIALCFAVAAISRKVLELPALRLKVFFQPRVIASQQHAGCETNASNPAPEAR